MQKTQQLIQSISTAEGHTSTLESDISTVDQELGHLHSDLETSKHINDSLHTLDSSLTMTSRLLGLVGIIPAISSSASALKRTVDAFHTPIKGIVSASDKTEKVVEPIRNTVKSVETKVEQLDHAFIAAMNKENSMIATLGSAEQCINAMGNGSAKTDLTNSVESASSTVLPVVATFDAEQVKLITLINDVKTKINSIDGLTHPLININTEINQVLTILNPLVVALRAIETAFRQTIRVPSGVHIDTPTLQNPFPLPRTLYTSFTIKQLLDGVSGFAQPIMDLFNKELDNILKPLLRALNLNLSLPSIPGLNILNGIEANLKLKFDPFMVDFNNVFKELNLFSDFTIDLNVKLLEINGFNNSCRIDSGQTPSVLLKSGDIISIQAHNGQYVCANGGGGSYTTVDRDNAGSWETFTLEKAGDTFAIKTTNGHYFCADRDEGGNLFADRDSVGSWEKFQFNKIGDNTFSFRGSNNRYACADGGGGSNIKANREAVGTWETFTIHVN